MKSKTILLSKIIIFLEYLSLIFIIVILSNSAKTGGFIEYLPWLMSFPIIFSIVGIIVSIKMKVEGLDEKLDDLGLLGPKPHLFKSSRKQLLVYSIIIFIFSIFGLISVINLF